MIELLGPIIILVIGIALLLFSSDKTVALSSDFAKDLGISPFPLLMAVAVSASAAFLSPVGHSANILVMGPGGYRFSDYIKVGLPLTLVVLVVVVLVMPIFWPF